MDTDTKKIPNPLPDPVPGRRDELEFPITDAEEEQPQGGIALSGDFPDREDLRDAREDDFDVRISDFDDFDYE